MSQPQACCTPVLAAPAANRQGAPDPQHVKSILLIEAMDCPTEERLIREQLENHPQVSALYFNLLERQLQIHHQAEALPAIIQIIQRLGMQAKPLTEHAAASSTATPSPTPTKTLIAAGGLALFAELLEWFAVDANWLVFASALASILLIGLPIVKKGWIALLNRHLNINALMSIAVTGALLIGHWPEAAMVTFLFALAEMIEARSLGRARDAVKSLLVMTPELAVSQQADGQWQATPVAQIAVGSLVRLKPGERVALDGIITQGQSAFDQSAITGESLPVEKKPHDTIFAGSLNTSQEVIYQTSAGSDDSLLAKIMHRVQEAQSSQAPMQRFVDKFSQVYTPSVVLIALLVAILPPLLGAGLWLDWVYNALVLLVIACPCALVISTPVAVVSALTRAARLGILIKGGVYLEQAKDLTHIAFDKTGTLTQGQPSLVGAEYFADTAHSQALALALTERSDHPVSQAIFTGLSSQSATVEKPTVDNFTALLGLGTQARIEQQTLYLGNVRLIQQLKLLTPELEQQVLSYEQQGCSLSLLATEQQVLALFAVRDQLRAETTASIKALKQLGIHSLMLSGDNQLTAQVIAEQAGIEQALAPLLPEDKLTEIERLQAQGYQVAMVGDGINDAPALAKANMGIAMAAAGTDTAIETADIALLDDDLQKIPQLIKLSQATSAILWQNISLALGLKLIFLLLALTGHATMWMAVFADMGASLLVTFNSLRLLRHNN
ncbi:heavy metal translocating P-type ATPase [Thiopseudomonas alkaliphila]|uniref:heavy metal translocating P-type ATPase n=1 Tax=Thiopseudomonas alkaliphila TaxID=1697053 RepID=UPI0009BA6D95|nr:heavy metal translocating P-type ATPase [Thiopseudomonas alkaliphila]